MSSTRHDLFSILFCTALVLPSLQCGGGNESGNDSAAGAQPSTAVAANGAAGSMTGSQSPAAQTPASSETAASDTWGGYAQGFFASYCVSCHNDDNRGDAARDFHQSSAVDAEADEIACGVSKSSADWSARGCSGFPPARQFPVGNGAKPSDAERDRLVAWIDAGRP